MINFPNTNNLPEKVHKHRVELINDAIERILDGQIKVGKKYKMQDDYDNICKREYSKLLSIINSDKLIDLEPSTEEFLVELIENRPRLDNFGSEYPDVLNYVIHFESMQETIRQKTLLAEGKLDTKTPLPTTMIKSEYKNLQTLIKADKKNNRGRIIRP